MPARLFMGGGHTMCAGGIIGGGMPPPNGGGGGGTPAPKPRGANTSFSSSEFKSVKSRSQRLSGRIILRTSSSQCSSFSDFFGSTFLTSWSKLDELEIKLSEGGLILMKIWLWQKKKAYNILFLLTNRLFFLNWWLKIICGLYFTSPKLASIFRRASP